MLTLFIVAILLDRDFYIDADNPIPWAMLYAPNRIDWRVHHLGTAMHAELFHSHDERMYDDFDVLAASDADPLVVMANLREFDNLLKWKPESMFTRPYVYSTLWHYLFLPARPLQNFLVDAEKRFTLTDAPYIGIHIRIGDRSKWWDPSRHSLDDVGEFLQCARKAEREHFNDRETVRWFLSTDAVSVYELPEVQKLIENGKIVYFPSSIHVDRSDVRSSLEGQIETQAAYMLLAKATAIVMSRSYFGETAAEIGPVKAAYFAPSNCIRTDLTGS